MRNKVEALKQSGEITDYFYSQLCAKITSAPDDICEGLLNDAQMMSKIGVFSEEDHKCFFYVLMHTKKIANDILSHKIAGEDLSKLSHMVYTNRNEYPINTILDFYRAVDNGLRQLGLPINKKAYPIPLSGIRAKTPHNVGKWMHKMREIYVEVHEGNNFNEAFDTLTKDWDVMEKQDFKYWMHFYQEDVHNKYKVAKGADYYQLGGDGPPIIPMDVLKADLPMPNMQQFQHAEEDAAAKKEQEDLRKEELDKKIKSIDGRLRSALKLISDPDVQRELEKRLDISIHEFVKTLQDMQRHILLVPLKSAKSNTLEDLIVRRGNVLIAQGHVYAGNFIKKLAQDTKAPPVDELSVPEDLPAPSELSDIPEPSDLPDDTFEDEGSEAIAELARRMNYKDTEDVDDVSDVDDESAITVEAQALPEEPALPEEQIAEPLPSVEEEAIEVVDEPPMPALETIKDPTDILDNIGVSDIIERLELVSNILKNREIPRQLAWIDLMMDKVGVASYFPSLAEATKSALESNQYMQTRIEDILSKLRGSIEPDLQIDLTTTEEEAAQTEDTLDRLRENLSETEEKERLRKEQRQKAKEEAVDAPLAPQVPIDELTQPVSVEQAPPARAVPTGV